CAHRPGCAANRRPGAASVRGTHWRTTREPPARTLRGRGGRPYRKGTHAFRTVSVLIGRASRLRDQYRRLRAAQEPLRGRPGYRAPADIDRRLQRDVLAAEIEAARRPTRSLSRAPRGRRLARCAARAF